MRVIGVIDATGGRAVHGRGGRRELYRHVAMAAGTRVDGDPVALATAYIERLELRELYVADLDAIQSSAPQDAVVRQLAGCGASLMVDAGVTSVADAQRVASAGARIIIAGLETLPSLDALSAIRGALPQGGLAFSLDLRGGTPMAARLEQPAAAPAALARRAVESGADAVIVLDVARVGMGVGLDLDVVSAVRAAIPNVPLLAGGGVRDVQDLRRLAAVGCDGALVATALHTGAITASDIAAARSF